MYLFSSSIRETKTREKLHPPYRNTEPPQVSEEVWAGQGADLDFPSHCPAAQPLGHLPCKTCRVMLVFSPFLCTGWAKDMRLDYAAILPEKKKIAGINKRLPVRYFTLARALSSASKYHTVIAYLGKWMEKELLNDEEKTKRSTWHKKQPKRDDTTTVWEKTS